jgi:histidinol phosphatase-like PHP family hydrolase
MSLIRAAKQEGARISLGSDAHHAPQLGFMVFSLAAACASKVPEQRILNFMTAEEVRAWARKLSMDE